MDSFQSPAALCRGTDFWMLNDELDENDIVRYEDVYGRV